MHNFGRLSLLASEIGSFQFHFPPQKKQNVGSIVVLILVCMGSEITASIPVQNDERFPFHSSLKAIFAN